MISIEQNLIMYRKYKRRWKEKIVYGDDLNTLMFDIFKEILKQFLLHHKKTYVYVFLIVE